MQSVSEITQENAFGPSPETTAFAAQGTTAPPLLKITNLSKSFDGIRVLHNLNLELRENEIVGLVGENGAGKSTLLNILSGTITDYSGDIHLNGEPLDVRSPSDATRAGISRCFQNPALVPNLPVYANLALSHEGRYSRFGLFDDRKMIDMAEKQLAAIGVDLDVTTEVGQLDTASKQVIEIARACMTPQIMGIEHPVILLDEPTASLSHHEIEPFFELVRRLKQKAAIILVSHRLTEILDVCDRMIVLKDGAIMASEATGDMDENQIHHLMVGRERDLDFYKDNRTSPLQDETLLSVENLTHAGEFSDVSFDISAGEIISIVGVLGSGKHALGEVISGHKHASGGSVQLDGRYVTADNYRAHMEAGLAYTPGDRLKFGVIGPLSGRENASLSSIEDQYSSWSFLRTGKERSDILSVFERTDVRPENPELQVRNLSGGNQQKVLLSRSILRNPKVFVLDNPTAAVDAGVKEQLYDLMRDLTDQGCGIVLISDDLLEAIHMGSKLLIMKNGRVETSIAAPVGEKPAERDVVKHMV